MKNMNLMLNQYHIILKTSKETQNPTWIPLGGGLYKSVCFTLFACIIYHEMFCGIWVNPSVLIVLSAANVVV